MEIKQYPENPDYLVSSDGRIFYKTLACLVSTHPLDKGYVGCYIRGKGSRKVHRVVALTFLPTNDTNLCINHIDKNKANNNVNNLEWCNVSYNNAHSHKERLANLPRGEDAYQALYTNEEIRNLCEILMKGVKPKEASKITGISHNTVLDVKRHKAYKIVSLVHEFPKHKSPTTRA